MTAPTVVRRDGIAELVVGSTGSNRIRSALLQVIAHVVDGRMSPQRAVDAPRLHLERGAVHAEPGIDVAALRATGRPVSVFAARSRSSAPRTCSSVGARRLWVIWS
ncbi:MAG: gamma-glutamyltranspeptidase / glutathione hydrolase [Pseudonocardiales bacterium]|nr:gamma-glutamyltranspeptidase / glutathione hydrolase [Pseudonocardiales bacterium]